MALLQYLKISLKKSGRTDEEDGANTVECNCNSSNYKYEACGHIITGDLNIIKDVKLRNLIKKVLLIGNKIIIIIDWEVNRRNCKEKL